MNAEDISTHKMAITATKLSTVTLANNRPVITLVWLGLQGTGILFLIFDSTIDSLDECDAHSDATRGYHCHLAAPGTNRLIGVFLSKALHSLLKIKGVMKAL